MSGISETIFKTKNVLIPMADVQHIEYRPNGAMIIMKSTHYNATIDEWNNPVWICPEELKLFEKAYCLYRHQIDGVGEKKEHEK